ncbi:Fis family transcriptional regulator [Thermochromatium tepidum ATCC 43061]|uniref:Putative Fis-like DNA-binding protein n=1 Tax=Thermochromatium tepidum ATCC 43061 TaxID=316276 RepID=A0A6I6DYU4_THETI|nr:helix-turn-helix domain-containing protein [Thermochromatium tepidum]QGU31905.1 Fis family transcriptional regulator [Thermochromatium tepidum ATCC 43061]
MTSEAVPTPFELPPAVTGLAPDDHRHAAPLSQCVRAAVEAYLTHMAGHEIEDLYDLVMQEVERPLFELVLHHTRGNLSQAARLLGLTRNTLRKRLKAHGLDR